MYRLIEYGWMLRDHRRLDGYRRALSSAISPSSVVLDLGAGIGTFSLIACRLGAARVYAVEPGDAITLAEELARANGVAERIRFLQARAVDVELPEKVDILVSDLSGALPLFEEHIPSVIHAREHFLGPRGAMIPERDRLMCAPFSNEIWYQGIVEPWRSLPGIDLRQAERMALNTAVAAVITPDDLQGAPQSWGELDYATITSPNVRATLEWPMARATVIHGIALWFESTLRGDICIASGPWFPESIYSTMALPLVPPVQVRENETLHLTIEATLASGRYVTTWQAGTDREPGSRQSTFLSEPRSATSLTARSTERATGGFQSARAGDEFFRVSAHVLARKVRHELLLLDQASGTYHILNETGARVWASLERGDGLQAIAAAVVAEFDVDARRAASDVAAIVAHLHEANLIERVTV